MRVELNPHTVSILTTKGHRVISATLTPTTCSVIYYRSVKEAVPRGVMAIDVNEDNITTFDTLGQSLVLDLQQLRGIHEAARRTKSRFRRQDVRIKQRIYKMYADIEHNRETAVLHRASTEIVSYAARNHLAIVMEDLSGIREQFRRNTRSSRFYLSYMNAWPFRQLQRQIYYKARWKGLIVRYVDPEWTSEKCSECDGPMEKPPVPENILVCMSCGLVVDRDLNAAKNILKKALRSGVVGFGREAMTGKSSLKGPSTRADPNHLHGGEP